MDYTNNFNADSFQNIYNPQVESQHNENKNYPAMDQQQQNQNFNSLVYQQPNAFNTIDNNNLYSDLDSIDDTPLVAGMELYDTDPLDNSMINQDQNLFQPTPNMQPNMFGGYDEPKLAHFNTNIGMQDPMNSLQSGMIATNSVPTSVQVHSNVIQSSSNVIQQPQSHVIQPNPNSNQGLHGSVNNTDIDPIQAFSSYYKNSYNPAATVGQTCTPVASNVVPASNQVVNKPEDKLPVATNNLQNPTNVANAHASAANVTSNTQGTANGVVQNTGNATTEPMDDVNTMADEQEVVPLAEHGVETHNGHDPLADAPTEQATTNGVTAQEDGEKGDEEETKEELEKCVREGCENVAVVNNEWEDEYCSNECCIKHCTSVFNAWVQENLKASGGTQNAGTTVM